MVHLSPPFRIATSDDAADIARLCNIAGDGIALTVWTEAAGPDKCPWAYGVARQADHGEEVSIVLADEGDGVLAGLTGFPIVAQEPVDRALAAVLRPLAELENEAVGTWHIHTLAALPKARGKGLGSELVRLADDLATAEGMDAMSVIVADTNALARRLYERAGFVPVASRRAAQVGAGRWLLMRKSVGRSAVLKRAA